MTLDEWVENYPESPLGVLVGLVDQLRDGQRDLDTFEESLKVFDEFLNEWAEAVCQDDPESDLTQGILRSLQGLADAAACLREYIETGDEGVVEAALALAIESQETLLDLMDLSLDASLAE